MVLDLEELRNLTMNDRTLMSEILNALIEDAGRHATRLEAAARDGDLAPAIKSARAASRACANVGANAAAAAFRDVERHATQRQTHGWHPLLAAVRAEIERLRGETAALAHR
jgi:HPt (histidine-containing phosphotransfer) domain-containing protein